MKDFKYYAENPHQYPNRALYRKTLKEQIDNTPMTAQQRETAYAKITKKETEWFKETVKPYYEFRSQRRKEFWDDCRKNLNYTTFLDDQGILALEQAAYNEYSHSYSEIYDYLTRLVELAKQIAESAVRKNSIKS